MPRESRKICKRRRDRNVALSSIREMLHSSCSSKRYSLFSRDNPRRSPSSPKTESLRFTESSVFTLTPRESPELNISVSSVTLPVTPSNITLPIPRNKSEFEEIHNKKTESEIPRKMSTIPAPAGQNAAAPSPSYKELMQNGVEYIMLPINLLQYCLWRTDSGAIIPSPDVKKQVPPAPAPNPIPQQSPLKNTPKGSCCPPSPSTPTPSILHAPLRINRRLEITSSDDSDDMVTADESHSPQKWSTPPTTFPNNNNSEKHPNLNLLEEPMEITLDDCPIKPQNLQRSPRLHHPQPQRNLDDLDYSSDSDTDSAWSNRVSSVDTEIAGVFARACPSSSSDSEASDIECPRPGVHHLSGAPTPLPYTPHNTPMVRKKRLIQPSPRTLSKRRQRPLKKRDSPLITCVSRLRRPSTPSDSAFSEGATMSFQESQQSTSSSSDVESMEQDVDYGADNEESNDSNDGLSPLVPKQMSFENTPMNDHVPGAGAYTMASPSYPPPGYPAGGHPGVKARENSLEELVQRDTLQRWSESFNLDKSMLYLQIARNSGGIPPGFPGFPGAPRCHCGMGYYGMGMNMPQGVQPVQRGWNPQDVYPPAPTPLPHLYYQYPEFMNPPAECLRRGRSYGGGVGHDLARVNVMGNYRRDCN